MFRQFRKLEPNEFIVVGGDCSMGGGDRSCCQFLSKTKLDVPLVWHADLTATIMTNEIFPVLEKISDTTGIKPVVAYERNNGGVFEMDRLALLNKQNKYVVYQMEVVGTTEDKQTKKYGWDTNTATRPAMLSQLKECIDGQLLRLYDKETVKELLSFIKVKTTSIWKAQAEVNAHDDLVMSLAIAWQLYQVCEPSRVESLLKPKERIYDPITGRLLS